ncbi:autotransporter outer membrane beta-barrel domain-containing protein [Fusobacterium ulcerans]|uniref:autotransporter family protein n=1 Tax=Fusobacterium ulcerans TaxID=861 RepID=UPI00241D7FD7|nr:autotransporter outer membrane beta-barrel domain-containing protein [Fusobacterium ulcerans]
MLDKIIKAVKSSNKKRGRNITIGAVVGMLLSYTVVIGAEENYLWIKGEEETIKFSTIDGGGSGSNWSNENPYNENTWLGNTYTNNTILSGTDNGKDLSKPTGYGLKLSGDLKEVSFINNGLVLGKGKYNYGIFNSSCNIKSIINNGIIYGYYTGIGNSSDNSSSSIIGNILNNGTVFGSDFGIYNESYGSNSVSTIDNIINNGTVYSNNTGIENYTNISASSNIGNILNNGAVYSNNAGIENKSYGSNSVSTIKNIVNDGTIYGNYLGIDNYSDKYASSTIENIVNTGTVTRINNYSDKYALSTIGNIVNTGTVFGSSSGINSNNNNSSSSIIENIVNTGTVCGNDFGIQIYNNCSGPNNKNNILNSGVIFGKLLYSIYNYGGTIDNVYNYGILASGPTTETEVVSGVDKLKKYGLIIKNGVIQEKSTNTNEGPISIIIGYDDKGIPITRKMTIKNITDPAPSSFKGNQTDSILNALTNTYKVTGKNYKVTDSIINAYEDAVVFEGEGNNLTLLGTIVNGGIKDDTYTIKGSKESNTLTLQDGTIINGDLFMDEGNDILNIENGAQFNGTLDGGPNNDILNFNPASNTDNNEEIRIQRDISNFENININTNVTLYENTISNDGKKIEELNVTGVNNLTIGKNGILTLRIDPTDKRSGKIKGHALYNTEATILSTGGKLLLALNGAGNKDIVNFNKTTLDKSLVTKDEAGDEERITLDTTSKLHTIERVESTNNEVRVVTRWNLPDYLKYPQLNKIYHGILSIEDLIESFNVDDDEKLSLFLDYLNNIYAGSPYSYSSELSRKSTGMFRDIVTDNQFKADAGKWMIYGGLTHVDGGTKDTYYGRNSYIYDIGSSDIDADTKITGAYILGEYGVSDTLTSGIVIGGNRMKSDLSNSSKLEGNAMYLGAFTKKYIGNLKVTAGAGFQYGDYDADRLAVNKVASDSAESVIKYSDNYNDMTYDIYLNGRYSHQVGDNLFFEPYATLSYTYIDQDGANEGNKTLAIETDSKSFDYTVGKVGVDLKKVIPHEKGKNTLSAGVSYTKILDGADEEHITGRFKRGSDFDILVAHKNEHSIGLNAKYALELENGVIFNVKGTYSIERDSHNGSGKNRTKGEWIVGAGVGYKF